MAQCTAKSKRTKERCQQPAMHGRTTCYMHGGVSTTIGAANVNYKHGKYSRYLPQRLQQTYAEALTSPKLLSLSEDLAVLESRLADLFQRVDSGESGAVWTDLKQALAAFSVAMGAGDVATMNRHFSTMLTLVEQGTVDHAAWQEIESLWKTRARLTETETKTLQTMQQMISTEQLMLYMGALTDSIRQAVLAHVPVEQARPVLSDITLAFQRLLTPPGDPA
jgi:hypothetical protein